jgi:hypothetical protein
MHHNSGVFAAPFLFAASTSGIREFTDDGKITSYWSGDGKGGPQPGNNLQTSEKTGFPRAYTDSR